MRYVILGASIAGLSAASAVRTRDPKGEITMVTAEVGQPYYRPLIPLLIDGSKKETDLALLDDPIRRINANVIRGSAESVDTKNKTVRLEGGKSIVYDRLLIATGARPVVPKIAGAVDGSLYVLRTIEDANRLRTEADRVQNVVVIGGGMVGIKTATALRHRNNPPAVTIVEIEAHVLPKRLDMRAAEIITAALRCDGIEVITGSTVKALAGREGKPISVTLSQDRHLDVDCVVAAVGVQPNVAFLKDSGITIDTGVVVDDQLRTSVSDVYAAGDVAQCSDLLTGNPFSSALWTNAMEMGRLAGMNMAGARVTSSGFLSVMNAAEIAGIPFVAAGVVEPEEGYETIVTDTKDNYRKIVLKNDVIDGFLVVNDIQNAGVFLNLLKNRISIACIREEIRGGVVSYVNVAAAAS